MRIKPNQKKLRWFNRHKGSDPLTVVSYRGKDWIAQEIRQPVKLVHMFIMRDDTYPITPLHDHDNWNKYKSFYLGRNENGAQKFFEEEDEELRQARAEIEDKIDDAVRQAYEQATYMGAAFGKADLDVK